jgi:hypothetical protein
MSTQSSLQLITLVPMRLEEAGLVEHPGKGVYTAVDQAPPPKSAWVEQLGVRLACGGRDTLKRPAARLQFALTLSTLLRIDRCFRRRTLRPRYPRHTVPGPNVRTWRNLAVALWLSNLRCPAHLRRILEGYY